MRKNPVKDIKIDATTSLEDLISQFGNAGGFVASKISTATSIVKEMHEESCTKFYHFQQI